ncbi:kinesin-domain-containing protein [Gigaspora margarita]|uniref:Kinesin-domain-containing protein n=1 Tax=Gigaspora margarita TaxID=4874 RepID=A0A8H4ETN5_GIGMA|nr:kinesin-domain-containing protein [Gigaspora margarita]
MLNHQASFADHPLSKKELTRNEKDIATISSQRTVLINEPKIKVDLTKYVEQHTFFFDNMFDTKATNEKVFKWTALPLVDEQTDKLRFIDLAGRECRANIGDADKQTRMEGAEINKSSFLSNYPITSEEVSDSVVIYCMKTPTQAMKATEKYAKLMPKVRDTILAKLDSVDCRIIMPSTEFSDIIKIIKKIVTK